QTIATNVGKFGRDGELVSDAIGRPDGGVEVVVAIVRMDALADELFQFLVRPSIRSHVGQAKAYGSMAFIQSVRTEDVEAPASTNTAWAHIVRVRRRRHK